MKWIIKLQFGQSGEKRSYAGTVSPAVRDYLEAHLRAI